MDPWGYISCYNTPVEEEDKQSASIPLHNTNPQRALYKTPYISRRIYSCPRVGSWQSRPQILAVVMGKEQSLC